MTTNWLDDAQLDALITAAESTRSKAVTFDPEAPGGFRALTDQEDRDLIDAIRLPAQRHEDDRAHLAREQVEAERSGDRDGVDEARAHQQVLDEERARDERSNPQLPPASGQGYDPHGPRIWEDGRQLTYREIGRAAREAAANERDAQWWAERDMDQRAADLGVLQRSGPQRPSRVEVEREDEEWER